jgi:hypothetical protein
MATSWEGQELTHVSDAMVEHLVRALVMTSRFEL